MSLYAMVQSDVCQSNQCLALDFDEEQMWYASEGMHDTHLARLFAFCSDLYADGVLNDEPELDAENKIIWIGDRVVKDCTGKRLEFVQ